MSTICRNFFAKSLKTFRLMSQIYEKKRKKNWKRLNLFIISPVTKNAVLTSLQSFRRWNSNCFQPKNQKSSRINFSRKDSSPQNLPRHVESSIDKLMETLSLIVWTFCSQIQKIVWKSISSSEIFFPFNVSSDKKTQFKQCCRNFSF